jgi:hypothetical protein
MTRTHSPDITAPPRRAGRLTGLERVDNGRGHRIIGLGSVRDFCARQNGVRIDLEGDGDQREDENDGQGSHGRFCHARLRPKRSDISAKSGSFSDVAVSRLVIAASFELDCWPRGGLP